MAKLVVTQITDGTCDGRVDDTGFIPLSDSVIIMIVIILWSVDRSTVAAVLNKPKGSLTSGQTCGCYFILFLPFLLIFIFTRSLSVSLRSHPCFYPSLSHSLFLPLSVSRRFKIAEVVPDLVTRTIYVCVCVYIYNTLTRVCCLSGDPSDVCVSVCVCVRE